MSNFTASNGVELDEFGDCTMGYETYGRVHEARKEFYQNLRDKELGQTREGSIVVRPLNDDEVLVLDETTGEYERWYRDQISFFPGVFGHEEAKRYFAAHSEPKPWHDAEPGEVWVLKVWGEELAYIRTATQFTNWGTPTQSPTDAEIKSGYRIWPEGAK